MYNDLKKLLEDLHKYNKVPSVSAIKNRYCKKLDRAISYLRLQGIYKNPHSLLLFLVLYDLSQEFFSVNGRYAAVEFQLQVKAAQIALEISEKEDFWKDGENYTL